MDLGLKGKKALVMGASSGIGKAVAASLVKEGADVAICSRNEGRVNAAAEEVGARLALVCDLSDKNAGRNVVNQVIDEWGQIDILVVNTGGPPKGLFRDLTDSDWRLGFENLWMSAVDSIQVSLKKMTQNNFGRIILITSVAAKEAMPMLTISNGLRSGLLGLTRTISNEVADQGVTINAVLPGFTDTERLRELNIPEDKIRAQVPAGRLAAPSEIGDLAAFLASERAAYITGQNIACDGGYLRGH